MNGEKIVIVICFALLAAVIIFRVKTPSVPVDLVDAPAADSVAIDPLLADVRASQTPASARYAKKDTFMRYNQPWLFTPPWGNILPSKVAPRGAISVVVENQMNLGDCS